MANSTEAFFSTQLDSIHPGVVSLGVPVLDGIVQIDAPEVLELTHLTISKDQFGHIAVKMANEQPLQVELVMPKHLDDQRTTERIQLFEDPVDELRFFKAGSGLNDKNIWAAEAENLFVTDMIGLRTLANTIGDYAWHKQEAERFRSLLRRKTPTRYL